MFLLNWRNVLIISIGLRFYFALSNSYIHPDEHFQTFEPLASLVFGYTTNLPWEFKLADPARSMAPLLFIYYPMMKLANWLQLTPLQTWYMVRLMIMAMSWMITDWCLYRMLPTKQERIKAIFFVLTSYVSLVYQSHTFSNSIETALVVLVVYLINELRFLRSVQDSQYNRREIAEIGLVIGAFVAFATFNRVTFPVFIALPIMFLLQACVKWTFLLPCLVFSFSLVTAFCIIIDTAFYKEIPVKVLLSNWATTPFSFYIVTPLNNILYNTQLENLSLHGIHPLYNHIVVNLPQMMGPGLILLFGKGKNVYWKTTPFLAAAGGILLLSMIPHQELRFLTPVLPLLCSCFDLTTFNSFENKSAWLINTIINFWIGFNMIFAVILGIFHQGGVVPAMDHFFTLSVQPSTIIWWRTYMAPSWMLGDTSNSTQFIQLNNEDLLELDSTKTTRFIDTMGMLYEKLNQVLSKANKFHGDTYLVTPVASFNQFFNSSDYERIWKYNYHFDMDHLDFTDPQTLKPGLAIYRLL